MGSKFQEKTKQCWDWRVLASHWSNGKGEGPRGRGSEACGAASAKRRKEKQRIKATRMRTPNQTRPIMKEPGRGRRSMQRQHFKTTTTINSVEFLSFFFKTKLKLVRVVNLTKFELYFKKNS